MTAVDARTRGAHGRGVRHVADDAGCVLGDVRGQRRRVQDADHARRLLRNQPQDERPPELAAACMEEETKGQRAKKSSGKGGSVGLDRGSSTAHRAIFAVPH